MNVLVPIDGSDPSFRALEFAVEFVQRYEGSLHAVHVTDYEDESTGELLERAEETIEQAGLSDDPEVVVDLQLSSPRYANRIGKEILGLVDEREYDHVVMGHHGTGGVGRMILGSAAETVVKSAETPVTVIP